MSDRKSNQPQWEDWQLTAYVLGEVEQDIASEIKAAAADDSALASELAAIEDTLGQVSSVFQQEASARPNTESQDARFARIVAVASNSSSDSEVDPEALEVNANTGQSVNLPGSPSMSSGRWLVWGSWGIVAASLLWVVVLLTPGGVGGNLALQREPDKDGPTQNASPVDELLDGSSEAEEWSSAENESETSPDPSLNDEETDASGLVHGDPDDDASSTVSGPTPNYAEPAKELGKDAYGIGNLSQGSSGQALPSGNSRDEFAQDVASQVSSSRSNSSEQLPFAKDYDDQGQADLAGARGGRGRGDQSAVSGEGDQPSEGQRGSRQSVASQQGAQSQQRSQSQQGAQSQQGQSNPGQKASGLLGQQSGGQQQGQQSGAEQKEKSSKAKNFRSEGEPASQPANSTSSPRRLGGRVDLGYKPNFASGGNAAQPNTSGQGGAVAQAGQDFGLGGGGFGFGGGGGYGGYGSAGGYAGVADAGVASGPGAGSGPGANAGPGAGVGGMMGGGMRGRGSELDDSFSADADHPDANSYADLQLLEESTEQVEVEQIEELSAMFEAESALASNLGPSHPAVLRTRVKRKEMERLLHEQRASRRAPSESIGDRFEPIFENSFKKVSEAPLSTFSIDVDSASYAKSRQLLLEARRLPPVDAVRIEEFVNYFEYEYSGPKTDDPFGADLGIASCPWRPAHQLVRIALQATKLDLKERPKANIVFLLDVSGSMDEPNKLPLVKESMRMLIEQLGENDKVAMAVYAGAAGCVLESTRGNKQKKILGALDHLNAGGSTNGGQGIQLAYDLARDNFIPDGINRVILCTDGDFNVGVTNTKALVDLVEENAKSKVFLTVLGYGMGNTNDAMMEQISNRGNGVYGFVDSRREAHRQMVRQLAGNLVTVAKDVKIQVEFNPAKVKSYRLLGYENRVMAAKDFNDDTKDAGEIGAGHRVTALYEVVPVGAKTPSQEDGVDPLRYQTKAKSDVDAEAESDAEPASEFSDELLAVKLRYKQPEGDTSKLLVFPLEDQASRFDEADRDFRWASSMVEFGMLLRNSRYKGSASWSSLIERATAAAGVSPDADRQECLEMIRTAAQLSGR